MQGEGKAAGSESRKDSGDVKAFRLEACQVSTVAKSLVDLVRATLAEACSDHVSRAMPDGSP